MAQRSSLWIALLGGAAAGAGAAWMLLRRRNDTLDQLRPLVLALITEHEHGHLCRIAAAEPFPFLRDGTTAFFAAELRRLQGIGFLGSRPGKSVETLLAEGGYVGDHLYATPLGEEYMAMRRRVGHGPLVSD